MLTVLVVVTHVGFLLSAGEAGRLNGCVRDVNAFPEGRARNTSSGVDGEVVDVGGGGLVVRPRRAVYGRVELGAETLTILTFSNVNRACEGFVTGVNLNVSVGVFRTRSGRTRRCSVSLGGARAWGDKTRDGFSVNHSPTSQTPLTLARGVQQGGDARPM